MDKLGIMQTKHLCVLIHIRTKGGVGTIKLVLAFHCFTDRFKLVFICRSFLLVVFFFTLK